MTKMHPPLKSIIQRDANRTSLHRTSENDVFRDFDQKLNWAIFGSYLPPCGLSIAPSDAQGNDASNGILFKNKRHADQTLRTADLRSFDIFNIFVFPKIFFRKVLFTSRRHIGQGGPHERYHP